MRVGVITVSDGVHQGTREDKSGAWIKAFVEAAGDQIAASRVVPDDQPSIQAAILDMARAGIDVVLTTGGTGLAPRDVTPEATRAVIEREVPGLAEAMRLQALASSPRAMLSRAVAGVRQRTLIVNLPGSPRGVEESLNIIYDQLAHAASLLNERETDH